MKVVRNVLIVLAISILPFVVAEVLLRYIYPDKANDISVHEPGDAAYRFDEDYLVALKPNASKTFTRSGINGGQVINWKTNSDGFRGPELRKDPEFRIIVYGDSNIQAVFSELESTYVFRLEKYLKEWGIKGVEVLNAGVVGFGPDQSLLRFEREADKYKPDLVIFHIFADNDFGDIVRNRLVEIDKKGKLVKTGHKREMDECLTRRSDSNGGNFISSLLITRAANKLVKALSGGETKEPKVENGEEKGRLLAEKTLLILHNVPRRRLDNISEEELREMVIEELIKTSGEEYEVYKKSGPQKFSHCSDHYDIDIALDSGEESAHVKIELMESVLKRAKEFADSRDILFLVVIQPSIIDMTLDNEDVLGYGYLEGYPGYDRRNLTAAVKNACASNGIEYLNLFDIFVESDPPNLYFKKDDNHWNDRGQDEAARATAQYIEKYMFSR